jgi:hypothetical protein
MRPKPATSGQYEASEAVAVQEPKEVILISGWKAARRGNLSDTLRTCYRTLKLEMQQCS